MAAEFDANILSGALVAKLSTWKFRRAWSS
jgi:hypothetical protein